MRPKPYSKADATKLIKQIAAHGRIRYTVHAGERMSQRDISMHDVLSAIRNGKVTKPPRFDAGAGEWKYTLVGQGIDVSTLTIPCNINADEGYIVIITVY